MYDISHELPKNLVAQDFDGSLLRKELTMPQQTQPMTGRIVVTHQGPSGIMAKVNGKATTFGDREELFRAAVLLAEGSADAQKAHPPPVKGV